MSPPPCCLLLLLLVPPSPVSPAPHPASPPAPPPAPRALLVLRAACSHSAPKQYFTRSLQDYSAMTHLHIDRILSYNETCGSGWSQVATTRALLAGAVGAVGAAGAAGATRATGVAGADGGRLVLVAGALGSARCALLQGAGAVRGGGCAGAAARGRALAHLAVALGWRRVLFLPPAGRGRGRGRGRDREQAEKRAECEAEIAQASQALVARGLAVASAAADDPPLQPHVVVVTSCEPDGPDWAGLRAGPDVAGLRAGPGRAAPVLLFLQLAAYGTLSWERGPLRGNLSNTNLFVNSMPYLQMSENSSENLSYNNMERRGESFVHESNKSALGARDVSYTTRPPKLANLSTNVTTGKVIKNNETADEKQTNKFKDTVSAENHKFLDGSTTLLRGRTLILAEREDFDSSDVIALLLKAVSDDPPLHIYQLYTPAQTDGEGWRQIAQLRVRGAAVEVEDSWQRLNEWRRGVEGRAGGGGEPLAVFLLVGTVLLLLLLTAALFVRLILSARRVSIGGRGLGVLGGGAGGAVLELGHFQFPSEAEGGRGVDSGMESMLSCWLQQLHEFGGPDPPRHPSHPALPGHPAHPSQPSSTCSVNRLAADRDRRTTYKGDPVHMKYLEVGDGELELKRKARDLLLVMQTIHHDNLNPFIGCLCSAGRAALVWAHGGRGSLEDVLVADDIRLDWTFRLSLLTDLVRGARYLHASALRVHGRLSSRSCVVDARWTLRISDHGAAAFRRAQGLPPPPRRARDRLWTAPELLRAGDAAVGTQPGDVFSFAIIMQEVIVRGEPYCMLSLTPEEIIEKLSRPPPLIRPSVSMGAAPPEAVGVMRQCWSEAPELRPAFDDLHETFRRMHRGRKINIVDSMLEKYSNNLEELIKERTELLDMEKRKTEQLLNRMLPRSVAERLLLGSAVEPEEFSEVSIYFSDIVGFTELAARSSPVQVVDLLNDLYTTFDAAIEQHQVYKVETIGDAYMVVGGLPVRCEDHAERVATMALHLLHLAGRFRIRHLPGRPLHVRIGLHSGPCCAGVVGRTMPRYCLFGDTVNTAARMESTGAAWRVQVSARTAARLAAAGGYRLRERGLLRIKGKGVMRTYWLLGKEGFDRPLPAPPPLETENILLETETEAETEAEEAEVNKENACEQLGAEAEGADTAERFTPLTRHGWTRCGTMSADSSPPATRAATPLLPATTAAPPATVAADHTAPYSRYRSSSAAGGGRVLRRQWSLERGEALAAARAPPVPAAPVTPVAPTTPAAFEAPLALQALPLRSAPPRYRTRPDAPC